MTVKHLAKETAMTAHDLHEETAAAVSPARAAGAPTVQLHLDLDLGETAAPPPVPDVEPSTTDAAVVRRPGGDRRALLVARLLAAAALLVTAFIHARLAADVGLGGPLFGRGHLFAAQAVLSLVLALAMLTRDNRIWLVALVLSVAGLGAILASVYFPVPAIGPFPAINEPVWLMNKAVCAFAEASVITLWLVRAIAPPRPSAPEDIGLSRP
jgi:hypothetical protein